MKTLTVKVPARLAAKVGRLAKQRGTTRSAVIREAIEHFDDAPEESIIDRAGDLVGSLEGPGDLSWNPKHMKGFGK
ncbi:MAG: ribbon-helix-helix domain-containing protein [Myxococcaceae bacterium]